MKRFILIGVVLTAFLACSKDTVLDANKGAAIEFAVAAHTRAQEVTTSNLETFYVTAVDPQQNNNYYTDLQYTKSGQYFQSNPTYYWPGNADHTLDIYAYAPSASELGAYVSINRDAQTLIGYSPADNISQQKDFITAVIPKQGRPEAAGPVLLTFQHRLAQIEIKAKNNNTVRDYMVEGVRIGQVKSKGDFDFVENEWTLSEDQKIYEVTYNEGIKLNNYAVSIMKSADDNAMLLPQTFYDEWDPISDPTNQSKNAYISVKVKSGNVSVNAGEPTEYGTSKWVSLPIPKDTEWESGHKYIYVLDFSSGVGYTDPDSPEAGVETPDFGDVIHFEVIEWDDWTENDVYDHPLVGQWEINSALIEFSIKDENGVLNVVETFPFESKEELLNEVDLVDLEFITFINHNAFHLFADPALYFLNEDDGRLYTEIDEIQVEIIDYSETSLTVSFGAFIDEENQNGYLDVRLNYKKIEDFSDNYVRPEEYDRWEESLVGKWQMTAYYHTFTYTDENDEPVVEVLINCTTPEEVVEKSIGLEPLYYVDFYNLLLWSDNDDTYHFTSFRNDRFVAISAYDDSVIVYMNDITDNSFNMTFNYPEIKNVADGDDIEGICDVVFYYTKVE